MSPRSATIAKGRPRPARSASSLAKEYCVVANVLEINPERLWESLERSAEIGRFREVGLRRLALSAEDKQMRDLFVQWAHAAGCSVDIDRLGNIFARRAGSDPSLPPV